MKNLRIFDRRRLLVFASIVLSLATPASGKNASANKRESTQSNPVAPSTFSNFKRLSDLPILTPRPGKFDSVGAFNPAAVKVSNNRYVMLYRGQDDKGVSRIGYAESRDGVNFVRNDEPILAPSQTDEQHGIEDPRLSPSLDKPGYWDLTATIYDTDAQLTLFRSKDLKTWTRCGIMMPAKTGAWNINWTKSGAIVPKKIQGKSWMYYMGDAKNGSDQTGIACSTDGVTWKDATDTPVLPRREGKFDSRVVEPGPAPIITKDGILLLYNGADDSLTYKTGWALFDKNDPKKLIARSDQPIFQPEMDWEKKVSSDTVHQAPNVVFVEGLIKDGKRYLIYYGAADCRVGVASCVLKSVAGK